MRLKEKFEQSGLTLDQISSEIGKGKGLVCGIINGDYNSAKKELYELKIEAILDKKIAQDNLNRAYSDVWLSDMQRVVGRRIELMMSSQLSFFELILGESGMGKTFLLKNICKNDKKCIYIKARRSLSSSAFMSLIIRNLGQKPSGNTDEKLEMVFELLKELEIKLLVIDEADLFIRDNDYTFERKFELLREVFEYSKAENLGISVIAVGLPILKKRIDKLGGYLLSRMTYSPEMSLSLEELKKIAKFNGLKDDDCIDYLCDKNNARTFEKVATNMALGYDEITSTNLLYGERKEGGKYDSDKKHTSKRSA
ncbi:MAG: AAA family ATPase [Campylobacter sputorum]|uniref:AAA family ATPase n=1 Tax=Campylobacter sputorum TaxID=206 RepID=UPI002A912706|nr:AAA family ATPase [Campylobacter sputorum]MDY6119991.1 AAA family ATPase [Campylobacter sputorum]